MKKQSQYIVEEREVDVKEMFFHALSYWRFILIVALIGAALVGAMKYKKDVAAAEANIQAQMDAANAPEITVEMLEEQLSSIEIQNVWNAVQYRQLLKQRREYIDSSIYLNLNAFKEDVVYLTYAITAADAESIVKELEKHLSGSTMAEKVVEEMALDTKAIYVAELITIEDTDNETYFTIKVCADSKEECTALADNVEKQMTSYMESLKSKELYADLVVTLTERKQDVIRDEELLAKQNEYIGTFYDDMKDYKKYHSDFNNEQKSLFEKLTKGKYKIDNSLYATEIEPEEKETVEIDTTVNVKPSIASIIAGFLAGAIAAFAFRAFLYTISKNIHGEDEVKYLFGTTVFGVVDASAHGKKRLLSVVDRLLKRIKVGRRKKLSYETQLQLICTNILICCKNNGITKVHLSGSEMKKVPSVVLKTIRETLEKAGIEVSNGNGVAYDADSLMELAEKKNGILVEVSEKTSCEEIAKELNLCRQNEVTILGVVLVEIA